MGPCLCGDPACASCFPSGQSKVGCPDCGWTGKTHELGFISDESSELDVPDVCPQCGGAVSSAEEYKGGYDPED